MLFTEGGPPEVAKMATLRNVMIFAPINMKAFLRLLPIFAFSLSSAFAGEKPSLYWAPPNVTVGGRAIDSLLNGIFWLTLVVFIATQVVYIYYLIKYRRRPGVKAHYSHGNNRLELIWTTLPVLIFLGLAIYSNQIWDDLHRNPPADALQVNISSYQFGWDFRYPGADGKLGLIEVDKITLENKYGLNPEDAANTDDFTSSELVIPANRAIHIVLNSRDVIHSFYVPAFRMYQDAVPGRTISWVWFEVEAPGNFQLACSQLCGEGHYNMKAPIKVLSQADYAKWEEGKIKAAQESPLQFTAIEEEPLINTNGH
jgi:cytochrome c oxidase subunit 2